MTIEYRPNAGLTINGKDLNWGHHRLEVRKQVNIKYSEDNSVIDLSSFNNGDPSENIDVKRDVYGSAENAFFFHLNYDTHEQLESVEIHKADSIIIGPMTLSFAEDITAIAAKLSQLDKTMMEIDSGEYLFPEMKITIASNEAMEGDGTELGYFYAGSNIEPFLE
jgi:hypothetical protein